LSVERGEDFVKRRWPAVLVIAMVLGLVAALPERVVLTPAWYPYAMAGAMLAALALSASRRGRVRWPNGERRLLLLAGFVIVQGVVTLVVVVREMLTGSVALTGLQLLASSVAVWVSNAAIFAVVYWQLDRGGPEGAIGAAAIEPDWRFPRDGEFLANGVAWTPSFVDYLFLGFNTAVAFTPADAVPLTARAKLLMMAQAMIALVTIVVVASKAIGELGP
jgi:hypothetical protein